MTKLVLVFAAFCFLLCFQVYSSLPVLAAELPFVDIKANGKDASIVSSDTPVSITISVYPGEKVDQNADWWISSDAAFSPYRDWFSYVYPDGWTQGISRCIQTDLFKLVDFEVFNGTLPVGDYTFYFALDEPDGTLDWPYWGIDTVQVTVKEDLVAGFDPFIKGPVVVDTLYPVNIQNMSNTDMVLLTTLQGIVAKESSTQIYLYKTQVDDYYPPDVENTDELRTSSLLMKHYLTEVKNPPLSVASDPKTQVIDIVKDFKTYVSGYIVYNGFDITLNMAVTLCGIKNAIPLPKDDISIAQQLGLSEIDSVLSISSYTDFMDKYDNELNKSFVVDLAPTLAGGPKDYATMLNGMIFYISPYYFDVTPILNGDNAIPIFGWGQNLYWTEHHYVYGASATGNFLVASDTSLNLSLLSSSDSVPLPVPQNNDPPIAYDSSKIYMTFIMSDGDNLQLMTNNMNSKVWYGSPYRGKFPVGWTMPPAMYYLEPDVWNFYIRNATENDEFLLGPSTIGYVLGEIDQKPLKFTYQLNAMTDVIWATGIKTVLVFGDDVDQNDWSNYTYLGNIIDKFDGLFYHPSTSNYDLPLGRFIYEKPASQFLYTINPTQHSYSDLVESFQNLATQLLDPDYNDNYGRGFYALYGVRNQSGTDFDNNNLMGVFNAFYDALDKTKITVVKPSQFLDLMKQAQAVNPIWPNNP